MLENMFGIGGEENFLLLVIVAAVWVWWFWGLPQAKRFSSRTLLLSLLFLATAYVVLVLLELFFRRGFI